MVALPWIVFGLLLVEFSLADELPAPAVRRVLLVAAGTVLAVSLGLAWAGAGASDVSPPVVGAGPLGFLAVHEALRRAFRSWKGGEPVLATQGGRSGSGRIWFEPEVTRPVDVRDYLYSLLLGLATLVAAGPAMAEIIARNA